MAHNLPGPLDQQVGGREVSHHEVEIDVEALFHDLRNRHQYTNPLGAGAVTAEAAQNLCLYRQPVGHRETCMKQQRLYPDAQQRHRLDRIVHCVAHPGDRGAGRQR